MVDPGRAARRNERIEERAPAAFGARIAQQLALRGVLLEPEAAATLSQEWAAAVVEHPTLPVDPRLFADHLAERLPDARAAARVRLGDLLVAHACVLGLPAGVAAFDRLVGPALSKLARRFEAEVSADELLQSLRVKLLVGDGTAPPKLAEYAGVGFLENWVRVAATRAFIDATRSDRSRRRRDAADRDRRPEAALDLEVAFLKEAYRNHFRMAFAQAVRALPSEERALLRAHTVGQRSIDDLGEHYGVHRSTVARRLDAARTRLTRSTRDALKVMLAVPDAELESVIRLVRSNIDLSVSRLLASEPGAGAEGG